MSDTETESNAHKEGLAIADLRREYSLEGLDEGDLDPSPFRQFERWFRQAMEAHVHETNAMTLATASRDGVPSARIVLLKGMDDDGFVFYTNYESRKGNELTENPRAALVFYWAEITRQVRVEGDITRVSLDESAAYFASRSELSRLGAWASRQSTVIPDRSHLDGRLATLIDQYRDTQIPLPPYWGGFRLVPRYFEFWHGRPNRLHDRLSYSLDTDERWSVVRLSP